MPTVRAIAAEHADVFAHFEAEQVPECSVYSFSPARERVHGLQGEQPCLYACGAGAGGSRQWRLRPAAARLGPGGAAVPYGPGLRAGQAVRLGGVVSIHRRVRERELWPLAIEYMLVEEGHWAFTGAPDDWDVPRQRTFLLALADVRADDFPLP